MWKWKTHDTAAGRLPEGNNYERRTVQISNAVTPTPQPWLGLS